MNIKKESFVVKQSFANQCSLPLCVNIFTIKMKKSAARVKCRLQFNPLNRDSNMCVRHPRVCTIVILMFISYSGCVFFFKFPADLIAKWTKWIRYSTQKQCRLTLYMWYVSLYGSFSLSESSIAYFFSVIFFFRCFKQLNQNGWDIISFIWLAFMSKACSKSNVSLSLVPY